MVWGYIRETKELAKKAGPDKETGLCRTGLEEYLKAIFPEVDDWVHDKTFSAIPKCKKRPDYQSKKLKLIVEFDGLPHYQNPMRIIQDQENTAFYVSNGYEVVRIPFFIQLTNEAIKTLFGVEVKERMFDLKYQSLGPAVYNTPAFLCRQGIIRMAKEFSKFPDQYKINLNALKKYPEEKQTLIDWEYLAAEYDKIK